MDAPTTATLLKDVCETIGSAPQKGSAVSFQCTLTAASEAVRCALEREAVAEEAALSLAQRETLDGMRAELATAAEALSVALNTQGERFARSESTNKDGRGMRLRLRLAKPAHPEKAPSWWFALTEAIEALGEGAERLELLAAGQPDQAPARAVAEATARLLQEHHTCLLRQADRWLA